MQRLNPQDLRTFSARVTLILSCGTCLLLPFFAVALTILFWWPLYRGAGFIGGDLYPYFFPQKAFYAEQLRSGIFPLWNDLAGFGYPVLGESQTGAAYPFHLVLYRYCDLNTAYNVEHLLHYVLCFVATWLFARKIGLTVAGAGLAALVFTYGWFPPRACLEWAILTGAWMPVALWCLESFLQSRRWRYAIGLSFALGLQLLAGHFHLAFITQLLVVTYGAWRLWMDHSADGPPNDRRRSRATVGLILSLLAGAGLASIQLFPTWELKQRSTRHTESREYDPAYGHLPPLYLSQLFVPWRWYSLIVVGEDHFVRDLAEFAAPWFWFSPQHDLDVAIRQARWGALAVGTNKVEAHVYGGLVPAGLALLAVVTWLSQQLSSFRRMATSPRQVAQATVLQTTTTFWLLAGACGLLYATGWLLPIGRHLPGFSFFRGPGRYGILTTLAMALLAGQMLDQLSGRLTSWLGRGVLLVLVFGSTCGDLWLVSRMVTYATMVSSPPISYRESSIVRQLLLKELRFPRLLAPGPNVGNLLGVSCVPWYLGIAPAEYVDPQFQMPELPKPVSAENQTRSTPELLGWLSDSGVTHVLSFEPLDGREWPVELVWKGIDPFLNRVWGRQEPIQLYRFEAKTMTLPGPSSKTEGSPQGELPPRRAFLGRIYSQDGRTPTAEIDWQHEAAGERHLQLDARDDVQSRWILTELAYPGWTVSQGTNQRQPQQVGLFRAVEPVPGAGEIVWRYRPASVFYGSMVSLFTLLLLSLVGHLRFWHPRLVDRCLRILLRIER